MAMKEKTIRDGVEEYWTRYFVSPEGLCTLCANTGVVDTSGARSMAGVKAGKVQFCICPNGHSLRICGWGDPNDWKSR
jgi:hypothetical protein